MNNIPEFMSSLVNNDKSVAAYSLPTHKFAPF
jgi:hypothetical protein